MAFNNTVPYTIDGTYDSNTNLITFVVSEYDLDRATNLYDDLQWTEQFSIPAGDVAYKRNTNQVFIVQNGSADQFSIYQGWYDVQADITYNSIGSDLDDMVDALVAQNSGGGGGGTLYYDRTEAQAIALIGAQTLEVGALYRITLDGTSEGAAGDLIYVEAIGVDGFATSMQYFDQANLSIGSIQGTFTGSGFAFTAADATLTADTSTIYKYDGATDELQLDGFTTTYIYGIVEIAIAGAETLETITGGFEGMELTIFVTGGGANALSVADTGNIILDAQLLTPPFAFIDNNIDFIKLKKRGSNWITLTYLIAP